MGPEHAAHGIDPRQQRRIHEVSISGSRLGLGVAEKAPDHFQRRAAAHQQGGEGVPQIVNAQAGRQDLGILPAGRSSN